MNLDIEIVDRISSIDAHRWDQLVGSESPFLEYGFLSSLERSGCLDEASGWQTHLLIARSDQRLVGAVPLYLKMHSAGEFVFDWSWAEAAMRSGLRYYPKGVVAVPFTPVTGARILVDPGHPARRKIARRLVEATLDTADDMGLSSIHFNFIKPTERALFTDLGLPIRQGIQYHWKNEGYHDFDDFLGRFRSKKRSNIRRERRKLNARGVTTRVITGEEADEDDLRRIFRYYRDTVQKHFYGRQYLTEAFFVEIGQRLGERLHLVFAELDGEPFAGTFNLLKDDRLYGRYWGCQQELKFAHFETCIYRPVQWCIEKGIAAFEPGAGGEHKFDRGFEPTLTYSAHYIRDPGLRRGVEDFIQRERRQLEGQLERMKEDSPFK